MKVDLERLRRSLARYVHAEENAVPVATGDLAALLAVVDAARAVLRTADIHTLREALEPFTPAPSCVADAWVEADRWDAQFNRWQAQQEHNPRDRARDQLADAGVVVQRQFRSDQERIAELERKLEAERTRGIDRAVYEMVCEERDALEARVPALVEALRDVLGWPIPGGTVRTYALPTRLAVKADEALAAWEKP